MTVEQNNLQPTGHAAPRSLLQVITALGRTFLPLRKPPQVVRGWVRAHLPGEAQHLFGLTLVVGVVCGFAAVAFHVTIRASEALLIERATSASGSSWMLWTIVSPTLGGLIAGALLTWVVPGARGSGIPQVKVAFASESGRVRFRDALGKFMIGALQIGSGASLGREGPTVQICAGATSLLARLTALPPRNMRRLTPVGVAAGIAAAFNAPIAAVTFTIEEIVGALDNTVLSGVVVAAALAAVIERGVLGVHPIIEVAQSYSLEHASSLGTYALLGVAAAFVSVAFTDSLLKLRLWFRGLRAVPTWTHPAIGGLITGGLAVVVLKTLHVTGVTGGGYETLGKALAGELGFRALCALCVVKLLATVFSYSSGGAGGIFAPALFVGAMLGGAFGYGDVMLFDHSRSQLGAFALVGMGAVFAGVIRAPITSVLIIFEMTGGYGLVLPLMVANMTSYALARRWRSVPVYEALLIQDGVELPRAATRVHVLERLTVADAMTSPAVTVEANRTLSQAAHELSGYSFAVAPIMAESGGLLGGLPLVELRRMATVTPEASVTTVQKSLHTIGAAAPLVQAVVRMTDLGVRQLSVVAEGEVPRVLGVVAISDLVRAHARAAMYSSHPPAQVAHTGSLSPGFELQASTLMVRAIVIADSTKLTELTAAPEDGSCRVVRLPDGWGVLLPEHLASFERDENFEQVLRAADLARPAPAVHARASLGELSRALRDPGTAAAVVVGPDGAPTGVVTREALANTVLEYFASRVSAPRSSRSSSRGTAAEHAGQALTTSIKPRD